MTSRATAMRNLARANEARKRQIAEYHQDRAQGKLTRRHLRVLMYDLGGAKPDEIGRVLKLTPGSVGRILRRPDVKAERDRIIAAQRDALIHGQFGVQAMAKGAAIEAARTIIEQATRVTPDVDPGDQRRAAETVLRLSGDLVEKKVSEHVHKIMRELSQADLEAIATGRAPESLRQQFRVLGLDLPKPAIEVQP